MVDTRALTREEKEALSKQLGIGGSGAIPGDIDTPISAIGGLGVVAPDPIDREISGVIDAFTSGIQSGAANVRAQNKNFRAAIRTLRGDDIGAANFLAEGDAFENESSRYITDLESFDDFLEQPTASGFFMQFANATGQFIPSLAASLTEAIVVGGAITGATILSGGTATGPSIALYGGIRAAGGQALKQIPTRLAGLGMRKDQVEDLINREYKKQLAKKNGQRSPTKIGQKPKGNSPLSEQQILDDILYPAMQQQLRGRRFKQGAILGAFSQEQRIGTGIAFSDYADLGPEGVSEARAVDSILQGSVFGAVGVAAEATVAGSILKKLKQGKRRTIKTDLDNPFDFKRGTNSGFFKDLGTISITTGLSEGLAEGLQEELSVQQKFRINENYTKANARVDRLNALFAGFFGGIGVGAGAGTVTGFANKVRTLTNKGIEYNALEEEYEQRLGKRQRGKIYEERPAALRAQFDFMFNSKTNKDGVYVDIDSQKSYEKIKQGLQETYGNRDLYVVGAPSGAYFTTNAQKAESFANIMDADPFNTELRDNWLATEGLKYTRGKQQGDDVVVGIMDRETGELVHYQQTSSNKEGKNTGVENAIQNNQRILGRESNERYAIDERQSMMEHLEYRQRGVAKNQTTGFDKETQKPIRVAFQDRSRDDESLDDTGTDRAAVQRDLDTELTAEENKQRLLEGKLTEEEAIGVNTYLQTQGYPDLSYQELVDFVTANKRILAQVKLGNVEGKKVTQPEFAEIADVKPDQKTFNEARKKVLSKEENQQYVETTGKFKAPPKGALKDTVAEQYRLGQADPIGQSAVLLEDIAEAATQATPTQQDTATDQSVAGRAFTPEAMKMVPKTEILRSSVIQKPRKNQFSSDKDFQAALEAYELESKESKATVRTGDRAVPKGGNGTAQNPFIDERTGKPFKIGRQDKQATQESRNAVKAQLQQKFVQEFEQDQRFYPQRLIDTWLRKTKELRDSATEGQTQPLFYKIVDMADVPDLARAGLAGLPLEEYRATGGIETKLTPRREEGQQQLEQDVMSIDARVEARLEELEDSGQLVSFDEQMIGQLREDLRADFSDPVRTAEVEGDYEFTREERDTSVAPERSREYGIVEFGPEFEESMDILGAAPNTFRDIRQDVITLIQQAKDRHSNNSTSEIAKRNRFVVRMPEVSPNAGGAIVDIGVIIEGFTAIAKATGTRDFNELENQTQQRLKGFSDFIVYAQANGIYVAYYPIEADIKAKEGGVVLTESAGGRTFNTYRLEIDGKQTGTVVGQQDLNTAIREIFDDPNSGVLRVDTTNFSPAQLQKELGGAAVVNKLIDSKGNFTNVELLLEEQISERTLSKDEIKEQKAPKSKSRSKRKKDSKAKERSGETFFNKVLGPALINLGFDGFYQANGQIYSTAESTAQEQVKPSFAQMTFDELGQFVEHLKAFVDLEFATGKVTRVRDVETQIDETREFKSPDSPVTKVISGGQSGADILFSRLGKEAELETGGLMPKGFKTEDGARANYQQEYNMQEDTTTSYNSRTTKNVQNSDGTIVLVKDKNKVDGGSAFTVKEAKRLKKPVLVIDNSTPANQIRNWLAANKVKTLNGAGNRATKLGDIAQAENNLKQALSKEKLATESTVKVGKPVDVNVTSVFRTSPEVTQFEPDFTEMDGDTVKAAFETNRILKSRQNRGKSLLYTAQQLHDAIQSQLNREKGTASAEVILNERIGTYAPQIAVLQEARQMVNPDFRSDTGEFLGELDAGPEFVRGRASEDPVLRDETMRSNKEMVPDQWENTDNPKIKYPDRLKDGTQPKTQVQKLKYGKQTVNKLFDLAQQAEAVITGETKKSIGLKSKTLLPAKLPQQAKRPYKKTIIDNMLKSARALGVSTNITLLPAEPNISGAVDYEGLNIEQSSFELARDFLLASPTKNAITIKYKDKDVILMKTSDEISEGDYYDSLLKELGNSFVNQELEFTLKQSVQRKPLQAEYDKVIKDPNAPLSYTNDVDGFNNWLADQAAIKMKEILGLPVGNEANFDAFKKMKPPVQAWFTRLVKSLIKLYNVLTPDQRFRYQSNETAQTYIENTMQGIKDGTRVHNRVPWQVKAKIENKIESILGPETFTDRQLTKALEQTRKIFNGKNMPKWLRQVLLTADTRLRHFSPELADFFNLDPRTKSASGLGGLFTLKNARAQRYMTDIARILGVKDGWIYSRFTKEQTAILDEAAREKTPIDQLSPQARQIREYLSKLYDELDLGSLGVAKREFQGNPLGFFPRVLAIAEIAGNPQKRAALRELLIEYNPNESVQAIDNAIAELVRKGNGDIEFTAKEEIDIGVMQKRKKLFKQIPNEEFMDRKLTDETIVSLQKYMNKLALKVEFERKGGTTELDKLLAPLSAAEQKEARDIIDSMFGKIPPIQNGFLKAANNIGLVLNIVTLLGMTVIASLQDTAGPILRSRGTAGIKDVADVIRQMIKNPTEAAEIARDIGAIGTDAMSSYFIYAGEADFLGSTSKNVADWWFRVTGLEAYTRFTRVFAVGMAQKFLSNHAQKAKAKDPDSIKYLKELNITPEQVFAWEKGKADAATIQVVNDAVSQFVDESIVRPNPAQRPTYANDPRYALIWQLKSFFYAYGKTIVFPTLKETHRNFKEGKDVGAAIMPMVLMASMLIPITMLGWEIRERFKVGLAWALPGISASDPGVDYYRTDSMTPGQYWTEVLDRSGMLGPASLAMPIFLESHRYGKPFWVPPLGPSAERIYDGVNWDWRAADFMPIYSQLDTRALGR